MRKARRTRRSGFTLIEILLVVGILALLAAFAVPQLMKQGDQAKRDLTRAYVGPNGPIAKALDAYMWNVGKYPETDDGLEALYTLPQGVDEESWEGPYLKSPATIEELKDPWKQPFHYKCPGDVHEDGYDLWSGGPDTNDDDGKEDSDDIKNWIES